MIKEIKQGHESQFLKGPSCIKTLKILSFIELKSQINNNKTYQDTTPKVGWGDDKRRKSEWANKKETRSEVNTQNPGHPFLHTPYRGPQ